MADSPARPVSRGAAQRVVSLFRPYRRQVLIVTVLIEVTSTIGIINPLLTQAVFNDALFAPGGPRLGTLYVLIAIMAVVPMINAGIGLLQTYYTNRIGQQVMRDLRDRLCSRASGKCCSS